MLLTLTFILVLGICVQLSVLLHILVNISLLSGLLATSAAALSALLCVALGFRRILPRLLRLSPVSGANSANLFVAKLADKYQLKMLQIYTTRNRSINAFALALSKRRGYIVLHDGIQHSLTSDELQALLAHEAGHIVLGHAAVLTIVQAVTFPFLYPFIGVLRSLQRTAFVARHRRFTLLLNYFLFVLPIVILPLSSLLLLWLLRRWEYQADRFAVQQVGLQKMTYLLECLQQALFQHPLALEIRQPPGLAQRDVARISAWTHPNITQRLQVLHDNSS